MHVFKNGRLIMTFAVMLCLGVGLLGCATTSQIQVLEEKTQQAVKKERGERWPHHDARHYRLGIYRRIHWGFSVTSPTLGAPASCNATITVTTSP